MTAKEHDPAEIQAAFERKVDIAERFADLAAEAGAEYAAGRWELGNGDRIAVDYEPKAMWFGLGGFRVSMAHNPARAWIRARRALERLELDEPADQQDDQATA